EKGGLLDHQLRVLHEFGEGAAAGRRCLEMRKHLVAHEGNDLFSRRVPDMRPAQMLLIVLEAALKLFPRALLTVLIARFIDVEKPRIHQERDLLDDSERIGNSALPELRQERINAPFQFSR